MYFNCECSQLNLYAQLRSNGNEETDGKIILYKDTAASSTLRGLSIADLDDR